MDDNEHEWHGYKTEMNESNTPPTERWYAAKKWEVVKM